jgi:hypothetical protein
MRRVRWERVAKGASHLIKISFVNATPDTNRFLLDELLSGTPGVIKINAGAQILHLRVKQKDTLNCLNLYRVLT